MGMGWVDMKMGRLLLLAAIYAGLAAAIGCSAFASANGNGNGQEWDIILPVDTIHYGGPVTVLIVGPSGAEGWLWAFGPGETVPVRVRPGEQHTVTLKWAGRQTSEVALVIWSTEKPRFGPVLVERRVRYSPFASPTPTPIPAPTPTPTPMPTPVPTSTPTAVERCLEQQGTYVYARGQPGRCVPPTPEPTPTSTPVPTSTPPPSPTPTPTPTAQERCWAVGGVWREYSPELTECVLGPWSLLCPW